MQNNDSLNIKHLKFKILITGGAGYIGSHVTKQLLETTNHEIVILDNLVTGFENTIYTLQKIREFKFIKEDLSNWKYIENFLNEEKFDVIIHFAASLIVPESVENPAKYYLNNTANTTNLVNCAAKSGVKNFIFSSSAAVYGEGKEIVDEDSCKHPANPYGHSKLFSEQIIKDISKISNMKYVIFRYFNVAGASEDLSIGPKTKNATSLIKVVAETAAGKRDKCFIFGDDYNTPDGTGVRDYIHVVDLADAHIKAIEYLQNNQSDIFNIGYGKGTSVKEIINIMKQISNNNFKVEILQRREGDIAKLLANNDKITNKMNWKPKFDNLEVICKSAYEWERKYEL